VRDAIGVLDVDRLPGQAVAEAVGLDRAHRRLLQCRRIGAVGAEQQQTVLRHQVRQPAERQPHLVDAAVDVGVVELDVVDDGDVGEVLQELRGLVEERAVVFVAFDDEVAAGTHPVAGALGAEVERDAADEDRRVELAVRQQPSGQRRGRRLAMRAGEDDRSRSPEELLADRLRERAIANLPLQHAFQLGVAARDGVADDHQVDVAGDVLRRIAGHRADPLAGEKVAHRRVDVLVGAADVVAAAAQQRRERGHGGAADPDQVNAQRVTQRATPRQ
jgi:hypothetical protein